MIRSNLVRSAQVYVYAAFTAVVICVHSVGTVCAQSEFAPGLRFVEDVVLQGLPISTSVAFAGNDKVFLALKEGAVRVVENGVLLPTPFIDLASIINKSTDRGLLGIAVDPLFPSQPYIYLSYVWDPPGVGPDSQDPRLIRIVRYRADAQQGYNVAVPGSMEILVGKASVPENMAGPIPPGDPNIPERASCMTGLTMDGSPIEDCVPCDALSHTAGTLIFGPNRDLYASLGDGADYNGPTRVAFRAQDLNALSGRVIRIDPDTGNGLLGNPFYDATRPRSGRSRTWALGFRNPFRITLNPTNGQVYVGDVGTSYYEEINAGKGANFGWPCYEGGFAERATLEGAANTSSRQVGYRVHPRTAELCNEIYQRTDNAVIKPLYTYRHPYDETGKDLGASITGVSFYNGTGYPTEFRGALFYADYAQRFIKYLTFDANGRPTSHPFAIEVGSNLGAVQLISGPDSNLYAVYLDLKTRSSQVRRFRYVGLSNSSPVVRAEASPLNGDAPLRVAFNAERSYDLDGQSLSYSWEFGDGSEANGPNPTHTYQTVGTFTARVTVREQTAPFASSTKTFTIRTGVTPPAVVIDQPTPSTRYRIGRPVRFSGRLVDPTLSEADLSWTILQKHNQHDHLVSEPTGPSGSFVPTEHSDNTSYELCFRATLGEGLQDQKCVNVLPDTATYVISSRPPGALVTYVDDEQEGVAPMVVEPILGSTQTITTARTHRGRTFRRWSDGVRQRTRTLKIDRRSLRLTAEYSNLPPRTSVTATVRRRGALVYVTFNAARSRDPEGETLKYLWSFSDRYRSRKAITKRPIRLGRVLTGRLQVRDSFGARTTRIIRVQVSRTGKVSTRGVTRR